MTVEVTITERADVLAADAIALRDRVLAVSIATAAEYQGAADDLKAVKAKAKELDAERRAITSPMDEAKNWIMDWFRGPLDFLTEAEKTLKRAMIAYQDEQDRKAREEEARPRELARKEREKLERRAEKAEQGGHTEKAEELRTVAESVPVPTVAAPTKAAGTSTRTIYSAEVVDKMALIRAVADGKAPDVVLVPDMKILNAQARTLKHALGYPGVNVVATKSLASR